MSKSLTIPVPTPSDVKSGFTNLGVKFSAARRQRKVSKALDLVTEVGTTAIAQEQIRRDQEAREEAEAKAAKAAEKLAKVTGEPLPAPTPE
jgi:hypothetical protein